MYAVVEHQTLWCKCHQKLRNQLVEVCIPEWPRALVSPELQSFQQYFAFTFGIFHSSCQKFENLRMIGYTWIIPKFQNRKDLNLIKHQKFCKWYYFPNYPLLSASFWTRLFDKSGIFCISFSSFSFFFQRRKVSPDPSIIILEIQIQ